MDLFDFISHTSLGQFYSLHPEHFIIEILLGFFVLYLLLMKSYSPNHPARIKLTKAEEEAIISQFKPISLIPELTNVQEINLRSMRMAEGKTQNTVIIDKKPHINFATPDFLSMIDREQINKVAEDTVRKYGVGSCGPRGFYGTIDVHLKLEDDLSKFTGSEGSITYSSNYATITSVIPAFAKRGDFLVIDERASHAICLGAELSRCTVYWYKHNDMASLEEYLAKVVDEDEKLKRPLTRRFIVTEGIFRNDGSVCPLPDIVRLGKQYKFRIMLDESLSMGVLGKAGGGLVDHEGLNPSDVDLRLGDLGFAFGSTGGFCCGEEGSIVYQRLNGSGYVFSASPPPYLATVGSKAIEIITSHPELIEQLHKNVQRVHELLKQADLGNLLLSSDTLSPTIHLTLKESIGSRDADEEYLQNIVDKLAEDGIAITRAKFAVQEESKVHPRIKIYVTCAHTEEQLSKLSSSLASAVASL